MSARGEFAEVGRGRGARGGTVTRPLARLDEPCAHVVAKAVGDAELEGPLEGGRGGPGTREGVELFHGSPLDAIWDYVLTEASAYLSFRATKAPLLLVGHSHVPLAISWDGAQLGGGLVTDDEVDLAEHRWLLNPGSVGQPRGHDPRAAWLLIDDQTRRATFHRVAYPVERTQAEIRERGLPEGLAARLGVGE